MPSTLCTLVNIHTKLTYKTCLCDDYIYTHATTGDVVLQIGEMTAQKIIIIRSKAIRIKYPITIQCLENVKEFLI